jgi:uncharacterized protein YdcH (DUF465 family)
VGFVPSRDGRKQWAGYLPVETVDAMKEADEPMWKIVDEAVKMTLGLEDASTEEGYERRIAELKEQRAQLQDEIESKAQRLDRIDEKIERLTEQYEAYLDSRESYQSRIDEILDEMMAHSSRSIFGFKSELKEAAKQEYGRPTSENIEKVIQDVKERRDERDLAISDPRFTDRIAGNNQVATADGEGEPDFDWEFDFDSEEGDDGAE